MYIEVHPPLALAYDISRFAPCVAEWKLADEGVYFTVHYPGRVDLQNPHKEKITIYQGEAKKWLYDPKNAEDTSLFSFIVSEQDMRPNWLSLSEEILAHRLQTEDHKDVFVGNIQDLSNCLAHPHMQNSYLLADQLYDAFWRRMDGHIAEYRHQRDLVHG